MIEVCDALSYAHARGVVHRDIKPDNVLLSGRHALVTDFGVAKALSEATGRHQLTSAGIALGTPAYMAPEQAVGESNIDQRADIYAVGVLGYELICGRVPFTGRTSQEVLAAHVTQPPEPLGSRRPACPPGLEAVIMKCLAKRPADRWQSADELLAQLEPLATPSGGMTPTTTRLTKSVAAPATRRSWVRWLGLAAVVAIIAAGVALVLTRKPAETRLGRRLQLTFSPGLELDPALSPDGKFVAFVAGPLTRTRLYVRQVDGGTPAAITPDKGFARMPRWSPDGQRLVFSSERGIELIPAFGGVSRVLVPLPADSWLDAAWSLDGQSIVYPLGDSVFTRPVSGGASRGLGQLAEAHSCSPSPDGRWIACASGNRQFVTNEDFGNIASSSVWVMPAGGGTPVRVTDDKSLNISPVWLPRPVSLLYVSNREGGRDLYQVTLARSGRPVDDVRLTTGLNAASVSVSADGRRLAYAGFYPDCQRVVDTDTRIRRGAGQPSRAGDHRQPGDRVVRRLGRWPVAAVRLRPERDPAALSHAGSGRRGGAAHQRPGAGHVASHFPGRPGDRLSQLPGRHPAGLRVGTRRGNPVTGYPGQRAEPDGHLVTGRPVTRLRQEHLHSNAGRPHRQPGLHGEVGQPSNAAQGRRLCAVGTRWSPAVDLAERGGRTIRSGDRAGSRRGSHPDRVAWGSFAGVGTDLVLVSRWEVGLLPRPGPERQEKWDLASPRDRRNPSAHTLVR